MKPDTRLWHCFLIFVLRESRFPKVDSAPCVSLMPRTEPTVRVSHLYQQLGLQVQCCGSVEEAALFQFWHLLANESAQNIRLAVDVPRLGT